MFEQLRFTKEGIQDSSGNDVSLRSLDLILVQTEMYHPGANNDTMDFVKDLAGKKAEDVGLHVGADYALLDVIRNPAHEFWLVTTNYYIKKEI